MGRERTSAGRAGRGEPPAPGYLDVEELSERTGVSVRNIREYQDRGILPAPLRHGRGAWYDDDHAVRLELVTRLLRRGYSLAVIRDLVDAWAGGQNLEDLLGLETAVSRQQAEHEPVVLTEQQFDEIVGGLTPTARSALVDAGVMERHEGGYRFPRGRVVLDSLPALAAAGLPTEAALQSMVRAKTRLDAIARDFVDLVVGAMLPPDSVPTAKQLNRLIETADPMVDAAKALTADLFAIALRRAIDDEVDAFAERSLPGSSPRPPSSGGPEA